VQEWSGADVSVAEIEIELARLRESPDGEEGAPRQRTSVMTHVAWVPPAVGEEAQWAGWAASNRGDLPTAEAAYRLAARALPDRPDPWANLGAVLERAGRAREALEADERAAALAPGSYQVRFNLGTALYRARRWRGAAEAFGAAARLRPDDPQAAHWAAAAAARAGKERP
ncbi:MAG: tetratricopeptide repeat protein, partial [Elusimicrobia bacterium]|nr:tetratricopeptide repeat protein [Elusimicrobiota bacterium]